jgi:hypothetical protein
MGFSAAANTLPYKLYSNKVTSTKMFSMCFRVGGGFITLGGMNNTVHDRESETSAEPVAIKYAKLQKSSGWFTVKILDVLMHNPTEGVTKSILGGSTNTVHRCNSGKGAIVDSGTTDTYLPTAVAGQFRDAFKAISGVVHTNRYVLCVLYVLYVLR